MVSRLSLTFIAILLMVAPASAVIIDHTSVDTVADLPQATMDAIALQNWYFMHASVGGNMVDGMGALAQADPSRYLLDISSVGDLDPPPSDPGIGIVYENNRGNPDWQTKLTMFENAVADDGWRQPAVNIAMNKLCYIDEEADAAVYIASMASLEAEFPGTVLVYMTIPLKTSEDAANVLRAQYNDAVRDYCIDNERLLFDIADVEAHDPDGNPVTFTYNGHVYPRMYDGYSTDGGHLNSLGQERVALAWYATAAAITSPVSAVETMPGLGAVIESVSPNPFNPSTTVHLAVSRDGNVDVTVFDARGRVVTHLYQGALTAGFHDFTWRGVDASGRSVGSGVYLVRLEANGEVARRTIALVK